MIHVVGGCNLGDWIKARISIMKEPFPPGTQYIGFGNDERLLGGVAYHNFNGYDMHASIAVEPKSYWATKKVLKALFRYPFVVCGCLRLTVLCAKKNKASRAMVEHMGFKYEGNVRKGFETDDMIAYGMLRDECKWL